MFNSPQLNSQNMFLSRNSLRRKTDSLPQIKYRFLAKQLDPSQLGINHFQISPSMFKLPSIQRSPLKRLTMDVPIESIKYFSKTKPGCYANRKFKKNQDSVLVNPLELQEQGYQAFGVFDGHGKNGHVISDLVSRQLTSILTIYNILSIDLLKFQSSSFEQAVKEAFETINQDLFNSEIDCNLSGSTAATVYITDTQIHSANVGDSRAVLYTENDVIPLTTDHKPENVVERQRILYAGGRVESQRDSQLNPIGPERVWLPDLNGPGLAMTRSVGDKVGAQVGVISEPEVKSISRGRDQKFIVIASDGVWDYLTNEDVYEIVKPYHDKMEVKKATERLIQEASSAWRFVSGCFNQLCRTDSHATTQLVL